LWKKRRDELEKKRSSKHEVQGCGGCAERCLARDDARQIWQFDDKNPLKTFYAF
jgi:hypothetical protein